MINNINHTNLNYQTNMQYTKEENLNTDTLNQSSNLVNNKSQAVSEIQALEQIVKDILQVILMKVQESQVIIKIYAKDIQEYANIISQKSSINNAFFTSIDINKTLSNAYKLFLQLISDDENTKLNKEVLENIPKYFQYDTQNFNIIKIYENKNELMNVTKSKEDRCNFKIEASINFDIENNQSISKGDALVLFIKNLDKEINASYHITQGDTIIIGK